MGKRLLPNVSRVMRSALVPAVLLLLAVAPPARAQEAADVLEGLRRGGGWVSIPIERGVGTVSTVMLPTMGMTVAGCLNVWAGHTGAFEIRARDAVSDSSLTLQAQPGVGVPFSHTFGLQAQVDFDFRWSEPRDTTLLMWVGLAMGRTPEEACQPATGG